MKYVTGKFALNLPCKLETTGDWHRGCLDWNNPEILETGTSVFGMYGIETDIFIAALGKQFNKANHVRALLDMLSQNRLMDAQGMRDAYLCCDTLTAEVFEKVLLLQKQSNWKAVNCFMYHEYKGEWREFLAIHGIPLITDVNVKINHL